MYVYETTNLVNGKKYIGVSITKNKRSEKYLGSGILLVRAIKKYGRDFFVKVILKEFTIEKEARDYERCIIDELNAIEDDDYYNLVVGGYGGGVRNHPVSDETKLKISNGNKGHRTSKKRIDEMSYKTLQYDLNGNFLKEYPSKSNAERELSIILTRIGKNRIAHHNGFLWKYKIGEIDPKITSLLEIERKQNIEVSKKVGKLMKDDVISLVKDREIGLTYRELGIKYNITESCVYEIVIGKTYKWVWEN